MSCRWFKLAIVLATFIKLPLAAAQPNVDIKSIFAISPVGRTVFILDLKNESNTGHSVHASFGSVADICGPMALERSSWASTDGRPYEFAGAAGLFELAPHSRAFWPLPLWSNFKSLTSACKIEYEANIGEERVEGSVAFGVEFPDDLLTSKNNLLAYAYAESQSVYGQGIMINLLVRRTQPPNSSGRNIKLLSKHLENCSNQLIADDLMVSDEYRGGGAIIPEGQFMLITTAVTPVPMFDRLNQCVVVLNFGDSAHANAEDLIVLPVRTNVFHYDRRISSYLGRLK